MADLRNRSNVLVGAPDVTASGGALIGKVAKFADLPTDAIMELPEALAVEPAGYVSPDGVAKTVNRTTEKIKEWNGETIMVTQSEHDVTLKLTFMEAANAAVLKSLYGEKNVVISGQNITLKDTADELPHRSFVFEIKGGNDSKIRVVAPDGQVTNIGDVVFVKNDVIKYEVEIECFGDDQGVKVYQFIHRPGEDAEGEE